MRKNQKLIFVGVISGFVGFGIGYFIHNNNDFIAPTKIKVAFTYPGLFRRIDTVDCETRIVRTINKANQSIYIQAYGFTSAEIVNAIVRAIKRGVKVHIILDKENEYKEPEAMKLSLKHGAEIKIHRVSGIAHNKVMIIDGAIVITGSYNFTKSANERNEENLLIIHSQKLAQKYFKNWLRCYNLSSNIGEVVISNDKPWANRSYNFTKDFTKDPVKNITSEAIVELKQQNYEPTSQLWMIINPEKFDEPFLNYIRKLSVKGVDIRILCNHLVPESTVIDQLRSCQVKVKFGKYKDNILICDDKYIAKLRKAQNPANTSKKLLSSNDPKTIERTKKVFCLAWEEASESPNAN